MRTGRRAFLAGAAALAASAALPRNLFAEDAPGKPNSVFGGVKIGCITYSYRGGVDTADYTLQCLLKDGLSETELRDGPIRSFAGIGRKGSKDAQPSDEADVAKRRETQLAKCADIRKMFND